MQIEDETFIKLMKQQTSMSMDELESRFLGRYVRLKGTIMGQVRKIEAVSLNRNYGAVFRLEDGQSWHVIEQLEFMDVKRA